MGPSRPGVGLGPHLSVTPKGSDRDLEKNFDSDKFSSDFNLVLWVTPKRQTTSGKGTSKFETTSSVSSRVSVSFPEKRGSVCRVTRDSRLVI